MKKVLFALLCLAIALPLTAIAKPDLEKPLAIYPSNSKALEAEPNDDYTTANVLTAGDDMDAAIDVGGDVDFFSFEAYAGDCFVFETHAGDAGDTKLYLFDVDGVTQLDYDDDGGEGYYSLITFDVPADGTYYIEVTGYSSTTTGTYVLTAAGCPEPPNCDEAIDIMVQDLAVWTVDLCTMPSVFTGAYGDCTGYADNGNEALYKIYLEAGQNFHVTEDGSHDMSMYLVTDCADIIGSCVAGSDNCCTGAQELIDYTAAADGWYYLIVDGYSGCSEVTISIDQPVAADERTWDGVKSLYR